MEVKQKFSYESAMVVAAPIWKAVHELSRHKFCKIAGSLRRQKQAVGDIEILYVSNVVELRDGLFGTKQVALVDDLLESWLKLGFITKRLNVNGSEIWGPKNKLATHVESGIPIDFFATTEENWWVSLVVRTGSKETNLKLTMGAQRQGATLNAYGSGITWSDGTVTHATSEKHVFEMCGVEYKEPSQR